MRARPRMAFSARRLATAAAHGFRRPNPQLALAGHCRSASIYYPFTAAKAHSPPSEFGSDFRVQTLATPCDTVDHATPTGAAPCLLRPASPTGTDEPFLVSETKVTRPQLSPMALAWSSRKHVGLARFAAVCRSSFCSNAWNVAARVRGAVTLGQL